MDAWMLVSIFPFPPPPTKCRNQRPGDETLGDSESVSREDFDAAAGESGFGDGKPGGEVREGGGGGVRVEGTREGGRREAGQWGAVVGAACPDVCCPVSFVTIPTAAATRLMS